MFVTYNKPEAEHCLHLQELQPMGRKKWQFWKPKFVYIVTTLEKKGK